MRLIDVQHPFFIPMYRRVLVVVFCLGWSVMEFSNGAPFWGILFGAIGLYCGWVFFFDFHPPEEEDDE